MPLPHWVARFNRRFTNRFIEPVARVSSGFAVVHHLGRSSGTPYTTPVNVFDADGHLLVALTYGPSADWFRNVQSGPASIERAGQVHRITAARVIARDEAWPHLPSFVRFALRILTVHDFALLTTSTEAQPTEQ